MAEAAPPTGNRFSIVTPDNNSAPLIITTYLSLTFAFIVLAVRLFVVKWKRTNLDDVVISFAHLVALGHWVAMFLALRSGLGKALTIVTEQEKPIMAKAAFAGQILLMPALCLSELSVLMVLRRLFHAESRLKLLIIDATMLAVVAWGVAAVVTLSVACSPRYLVGNGECSNQLGRIQGVIIAEIITETWLFALSPVLLYSLDVALKTKILVMSAFSFRILVVPLSVLYLLKQPSSQSDKPSTISSVPSLLFQEILLSYALMSATIPCLKSFVEGFTTGGVGYVIDPNAGRIFTTATIGGSNQSGQSYKLRMFKARTARGGVDSQADKSPGTRAEDKLDGAKRISARLSSAWNGPGHLEKGLHSEESEEIMIQDGEARLLGTGGKSK